MYCAGVLEICSQQVAVDDSNGQLIWFCAWGINPATGSGSITWDETAGMYIIKDPEKVNGKLACILLKFRVGSRQSSS